MLTPYGPSFGNGSDTRKRRRSSAERILQAVQIGGGIVAIGVGYSVSLRGGPVVSDLDSCWNCCAPHQLRLSTNH